MYDLAPLWAEKLAQRKRENRLRRLSHKTAQSDFCSNDYLGLARDDLHIRGQAHHVSIRGSTGSRLISGNQPYIVAFENAFVSKMGYAQGLVFATGYSANLGLLSALSERGVTFIMDELCHASLIDGARLGFAKRQRFAHNDCQDLERQLKAHTEKTHGQNHAQKNKALVVVVESVYSMDGDIADLEKITQLCEYYQAALIVDEAHSFGVLGEQGKGLVEQLGLQQKVMATVYTFGKAPGAHGAIVAASEEMCEYLINFSRPFIYSTAPSLAQINEMQYAFETLLKADQARQNLQQNIDFFRDKAHQLQLPVLPSKTAIQGILIKGVEAVIDLSDQLNQAGFWVKPIMSPTVAQGKERIRICLHSFNHSDEIEAMLNFVQQYMEKQ